MICVSAKTSEERSEIVDFLNLLNYDYQIYDSSHKGIFGFLCDFFSFFIFTRKNKITKIIGAPCSRNRYMAFILGIPFASYMRSVHPDPNALTSFSDVLHYKLSKIGIKLKLLNPYEADAIFISTEINRDFLLKRSVSIRKIFNVGSIWLRDIELKEIDCRVIYLTQSFSSHRNFEASTEQRKVVKKIADLCSSNGLSFILRKHPRDYDEYNLLGLEFEINTKTPDVFLRSIGKYDYVIGSFSTMVLEVMSLGGKFIPIKINSASGLNCLFEKNSISPVSIEFLESRDFESMVVKNKNLFSKFDPSPVDFFCNQ